MKIKEAAEIIFINKPKRETANTLKDQPKDAVLKKISEHEKYEQQLEKLIRIIIKQEEDKKQNPNEEEQQEFTDSEPWETEID